MRNCKCGKRVRGHTGWAEGDTVFSVVPPHSTQSSWQDRPDPSVQPPSIHSPVRSSIRAGQFGDMKRPHDYSSPDSDTDEFIDVGQEDSYWWASTTHTCIYNTCMEIRRYPVVISSSRPICWVASQRLWHLSSCWPAERLQGNFQSLTLMWFLK